KRGGGGRAGQRRLVVPDAAGEVEAGIGRRGHEQQCGEGEQAEDSHTARLTLATVGFACTGCPRTPGPSTIDYRCFGGPSMARTTVAATSPGVPAMSMSLKRRTVKPWAWSFAVFSASWRRRQRVE